MADEPEKIQVIDRRRSHMSEKQAKQLDRERKKRKALSSAAGRRPDIGGPRMDPGAGAKVEHILRTVAEDAVQKAIARQIAPLLEKVQIDMRKNWMMVAQGANYSQAVGLGLLRLLIAKGVITKKEFEETLEAFESMDGHTDKNVNAFLDGKPFPVKEKKEKEDASGSAEDRPEGRPHPEGAADLQPEGGEGDGEADSPQHEEDQLPSVRSGGDTDEQGQG
jgi:hypothetical protein